MLTILAAGWIVYLVVRVFQLRGDVREISQGSSRELLPPSRQTIAGMYASLQFDPPPGAAAEPPIRRPQGPAHPDDAAPVRSGHPRGRHLNAAPGPPAWARTGAAEGHRQSTAPQYWMS